MFGANGPFNKNLNQPMVLRDFDSAAAGITTSVNTMTSSIREELSFIEHVRETALHIVSDLVNAVSDGTLEEDELPTDRLDSLIIDALDGADDEDDEHDHPLGPRPHEGRAGRQPGRHPRRGLHPAGLTRPTHL